MVEVIRKRLSKLDGSLAILHTLEIRENWIRMIGFRNVLVHDYSGGCDAERDDPAGAH